MANNLDQIQSLGKEQFETASSVAASLAKGLQMIMVETTDFSKKSIAANSAYLEKLVGAKSLEDLNSDPVRICQV